MDDAQKVMIGVGIVIALLLLSKFTGGAAPDEGKAINITGKDIPQVPNVSMPNTTMELPFVARHEITNGISIDDVKFSTLDQVEIAGTTYIPATSKPNSIVVLVHQLGSNRRVYDGLARQLAGAGIAAIAIDLRGHGGSAYKGGYSSFSTEDWISAEKDIDGALGALYERVGDGKLPASLVGASIGANLVGQYAADGKKPVARIVLLSPGLDFRGVGIEGALAVYKGKTLIMASAEDIYSFDSMQTLAGEYPEIETMNYSDIGHGTDMLRSTEVKAKILEWLGK